jgi:hypothetical protein
MRVRHTREGAVILRMVRGRLPSTRLSVLNESFGSEYVADTLRRPGLARFHVGLRPDGADHELIAVSYWSSVETAVAAFGDLASPKTLGNLGSLADFSGADYYEIDEAVIRPTTAEPIVLRWAAGRLDPGEDVEAQGELRRRLPQIDSAMTQGYVGRRLVGSQVEVAFVSTWAGPPRVGALEEPIWPDITGRYHHFFVRTYVLVRDAARPPLVGV